MQLEHQFTVPAPIDDAWKVLLDVPRVAPCMPGAALDEFDGSAFTGSVKVKLGPISLLYRGSGRFAETDEANHRLVMEASGKESRGSGTATATVTATMQPDGELTQVNVTTELSITGRPAQFGRGMINDVGGKLLGQFADCLATTLGQPSADASAQPGGSAAPPSEAPSPPASTGSSTTSTPDATDIPEAAATARAAHATTSTGSDGATGQGGQPSPDQTEAERAIVDVEPIDLLEITGAQAAIRRYGPYAAAVAVLAILAWLVTRRRRS